MSGTLYLVATPIGNLGDFSPRAAETLGAVDFIAAEDTRVSVKLLNHFQIKKPLVSYHEHNHAAAGQAILQRLLAGESCALVTDAGTPAISDPGEDLVRLCAENGVEVLSIPGCCAAVNAPNRYKDSDTARNTNVSAMSSSSRACSLGVFLRAADSTMAIILSRKL